MPVQRNAIDPNIVILAGGISSRMRKSAASSAGADGFLRHEAMEKPKSMMPVGKEPKPFLDYLLDNIARAGYRNVVIVVGERDTTIRDYYQQQRGSRQFSDLSISYAVQDIPQGREKPLGTADALLQALKTKPSWKNQKLTVCNSDNLYSTKVLKMLLDDEHGNAMIDYDREAFRFDKDRIAQFAVIKKDEEGFLVDILEKPTHAEISQAADRSGRIGVSMNIFRFSFDHIYPFLETVPFHPVRQEKELPTAAAMMVHRFPRSLFAIPVSEHVPDLTLLTDVSSVDSYLNGESSG